MGFAEGCEGALSAPLPGLEHGLDRADGPGRDASWSVAQIASSTDVNHMDIAPLWRGGRIGPEATAARAQRV